MTPVIELSVYCSLLDSSYVRFKQSCHQREFWPSVLISLRESCEYKALETASLSCKVDYFNFTFFIYKITDVLMLLTTKVKSIKVQ